MFQLALAGDGELRGELESFAAELNVTSHVHFLGRLDGLALKALHRAATGFVLTSHLEGLGTAVIDAMAAGIPVVATAAGGIPELIEDGRTGWLCPIRDDAAVALAMRQVMTGITDGAAEVTTRIAAARARVLQGFTLDAMVEGTMQSYLIQ
jgi:glycosyltransferase involved in cell wall biosynthesis